MTKDESPNKGGKSILPKVALAIGISAAFGLLVFVSARTFSTSSNAFYGGLLVFVSGSLLAPVAIATSGKSG